MRISKAVVLCSVSSVVLGTMSATAQDTQTANTQQNEARQLETIVVKARKTEESLQEIPVSITAFSSQEITELRIDEAVDYFRRTPNLAVVSEGSRFRNNYTIRGVSNLGGRNNALGIYVDEFNIAPASDTRTFDPLLNDVEGIEVLRGPQGTVFGRNAIGGAINITTKKPSQELEGEVSAEIGNFGTYNLRGILNIPITDTLAVRGVGYYSESDGFMDNKGSSGSEDTRESAGGRLALRWAPTAALTADISVSYTDAEEGVGRLVPNGNFTDNLVEGFQGPGGLPFNNGLGLYPDNDTQFAHDFETGKENENLVATSKISYDFGGVQLISVTGYIDNDYIQFDDTDYTNIDSSYRTVSNTLKSLSQELRLQSDGAGALSWSTGVIFAEDEASFTDTFVLGTRNPQNPYYGGGPIVPGGFAIPGGPFSDFGFPEKALTFFDDDSTTEFESIGIFGTLAYDVTDALTIEIGGRYTDTTVSEDFVRSAEDTNPFSETFQQVVEGAPLSGEESFEDFSPKLSLTYSFDENLSGYVTASNGFKEGGLALRSTARPDFGKEKIWNYEAGLKGFLFNNTVSFSTAAFFMDWQDIQVSFFDSDALTVVTDNAGAAEIVGFEAEFTALLSANLQVDGGVGYQQAEFTDYKNKPLANGGTIDLSGTQLPNAPEWTGNLALEYRNTFVSGAEGFARAEVLYTDERIDGFANEDHLRLDASTIFNLNLGFTTGDYTLLAYAENVFNDDNARAATIAGGVTYGGVLVAVDEPTYGAQLTRRF